MTPDRVIIRPRGCHNATLVRRSLAEELTAQGFTGIRWLELKDHDH